MQREARRAGNFGDCSQEVIGACIEVHRVLGPGLLESAYEACLAREFSLRGLNFAHQQRLPLSYKGIDLDCAYRLDFVVRHELVLEVKAVEELLPIHEAQLISYLRLTGIPAGLLINFHTATLRQGLRRLTLKPR
jgi:GxxExxY protein